MIFSIGDRVHYTSGRFGCSPSNPLKGSRYEATGTVSDVDSRNVFVNWDNKCQNSYGLSDLELIHALKFNDPNKLWRENKA